MAIQFTLYLAAAIALTVATGYYLWKSEVDNMCSSTNSEGDNNEWQKAKANDANYYAYKNRGFTDSTNPYKYSNYDYDGKVIDVQGRFNQILKIYFAYFVTEVVRSFFMLLAIILRSRGLAMIYQFACMNDCLGLAALIILHVYRFQYSGKYCTGDIYKENGGNPDDIKDNKNLEPLFLISRGKYLLGLVIWVWVGGVGLCCLTCILSAVALKS
jgi:hypothetical protein